LVLLGGCALIGVDGNYLRLKTRKSWALLALLAQAKDGECTREYLASLLWPRSGEEQARASLRQELAILRKTLHVGNQQLLEARTEAIKLRRDLFSIDCYNLEKWATSEDYADTLKIPKVYQGELAAGLNIRSAPFDDWVWLERQRLQDLAITGLEKILAHDEADGDPQVILGTAQSIIEIDPTHELAHQHLMKNLHTLGRRSEALAQFSRLQEIMRRELDADPSEETFELYHQIRGQKAGSAKNGISESLQQNTMRQEKRELTIAAFGIANPTNQHEILGAEEISDLLVQMEAQCQEVVPKFGGTLLGMIGDRCLAIFGYPTAGELVAERSVFAARELSGKTLTSHTKGIVQISCGIANGETLISMTEAKRPHPSHLSGSAVTQATTLSFMATGGQVLIGSTTQALLRNAFKVEQVAALSQGNVAYQVVREQTVKNRFDASEMSNTLSLFTGRDRELSRLTELWDKSKRYEGTTVCVIGEPGIGKSRLVHSFLRMRLTNSATVMQFSGSAHHQNTAFHPVTEEFRRVVGIDQAEKPDESQTALQCWLSDIGLSDDEDMQDVAILLRGFFAQVSDGAHIEKPASTLIRCFNKLAEKGPVVLIFEDFHWMDSSTQKLIREMQSEIKTSSILVVVTSRQDPTTTKIDIPLSHQIQLNPLSKAQAHELALQICPPHTKDSQIDEIIELSDGIPLFLEELINSISDQEDTPRTYKKRGLIPASLQETLMARIDKIGSEKEILHIASVIGREFSQELLQSVARYDTDHIESYLEKLQNQDLVYRIGVSPYARYEFKHALVQDLTYKSILRQDRKTYHQKVAQALKAGVACLTPAEPEVIAWHFENSGELDEALDYLEIAGRQAVNLSAHYEATQHFRHALNLAHSDNRSGELEGRIRKILLLLGPQLLAEHGFASEEVRDVYAQAESLSVGEHGKIQFSRVLWGLWSNYIVRAELKTAHDLSDEFLKIAISTHETLDIVAGHYMTGVSQFYTGNLKSAELAFKRVHVEYETSLHDEMIHRFGINLNVASSSYLLWVYALSGRFDKAHSCSRQLIGETELINHSVSTGFAHNFISGMHNFMGDAKQAERHARVAAALSDGQRFAQFRAQADINLGRALDRLGHPQGLTLLQQGLEGYLETGAKLAQPYALAWLAEAYMDRGLANQAKMSISKGLIFSASTGETYFDAELLRLQAEVSGRFSLETEEGIIRLFERSLQSTDLTGAKAIRLATSASFAHFLKGCERYEAAHRIASKELEKKGVDENVPLFETARALLLSALQ
jgi:predicted ATPase/DNA-binding SARP family transcriptional activator